MADDNTVGHYQTPWLAILLHSIPRIDMAFHRVNANFQLDSQQYKEVRIESVTAVVLTNALVDGPNA